MTKFKKALFSGIGLYIFAAIFPVFCLANAPDESGPDQSAPQVHSGQRIQEIYNQLGLTDDQKKQLEANKLQHRAKMESARQEMKIDKKALQEELMSPQLDMALVNQTHGRIKALLSQMEDDRLSSILAVRTILTPEQFSEFVNLMHKHKQEHGE
jgi:Spy/CpxP family protein refolding chaperone